MRKFLIAAVAVAGLAFAGAGLQAADEKGKGKEGGKEDGVTGILIDAKCGSGSNEEKQADHPASCVLKCADTGIGVLHGEKWIKFDAKGQKLAKEYLEKHKDDKNATKVHVAGKVGKDGKEIAVEAIHPHEEGEHEHEEGGKKEGSK